MQIMQYKSPYRSYSAERRTCPSLAWSSETPRTVHIHLKCSKTGVGGSDTLDTGSVPSLDSCRQNINVCEARQVTAGLVP